MDDQRIAVYEARIEPLRNKYREEFAALEARWVARRQAVIDRVEMAVPVGAAAAHDGLIEFHSDAIDDAHERATTALLEGYQRDTAAVRKEVGL